MSLKKPLIQVAYLSYLHSLNHSLYTVMPVLIPLMTLEGFRYDEVGLAFSASLLLYGSGALTSGYLVSKTGERNGIIFSLFLQGVSSLLIMINGFMGFLFFMLSLGFFGSFYHPLSNTYIYHRFRNRTGEAMGLHGIGANIGQITYPSLAVFIALIYGWKITIIVFGLLLMMASLILLKLPSKEIVHEKPRIMEYFKIMSHRDFILTTILIILVGLYFKGVELYLPAYLMNIKSFDIVLAGVSASVLLTGGTLGQYIGGRLSDKKSPGLVMFLVSFVGSMSLLALQKLPTMMAILASIFLLGLSFSAYQPSGNLYVARKFHRRLLSIVFGIWFFVAFSFGGVSTFIAGLIAQ